MYRLYIADSPSRRLETDLREMGHRTVRRIPHGGSVSLGGGLRVWSWQFGIAPVDSVCGIRAEDGTPPGLLDVNDCKVYGAPLGQLLRDFGRPEVVLRAHTSANAIPYCIVQKKRSGPGRRSGRQTTTGASGGHSRGTSTATSRFRSHPTTHSSTTRRCGTTNWQCEPRTSRPTLAPNGRAAG